MSIAPGALLGVLLLLVAAACGGAPSGERRPLTDRWPDGKIRVEGEELQTGSRWVKDGPFTFYDEEGDVVSRGQYTAGVETGLWREVYPDGSTGTGNYVDGMRAGPWMLYHASGEKQEEGRYDQDQRVGDWTWFYPTGKKRSVAHYVDGQKHGVVRFWAADGTPQGVETWEAGEKVD